MKKKIFFGLAATAIAVVTIIACKRDFNKFDARGTNAGLLAECDPVSCTQNPCEIDEIRSGYDTLRGVITTNRTLDETKTYILDGKLYIDSGAQLTINPGTLIRAIRYANPNFASAIVVTRHAKINAVGTEDCPIIFTSDRQNPQTGDWGGIVLLGEAPVNASNPTIEGIDLPSVPAGVDVHYGGTDTLDNSGSLSYVRIEYAGASIATDNELNGLTCGGVGKNTVLSYIQVFRGNDDAFEFFGGNVNADHLYAYIPDDDAFDFDLGYTGCIQFAVSVLNNTDDYSSNPNGIECDNDATGSGATPITRPRISNMTVVGVCAATDAVRPGDVLLNGAHFRRNTNLLVFNSIFMGFPTGVFFDGTDGNTGCFKYNIVQAFDTVLKKASSPRLMSCLPTNTCYKTTNANDSVKLVLPCNYSCPDFRPQATSPAVSGANFTDNCLIPACFTTVSYRGAFAPCNEIGANWLAGWTKHGN